MIPRIDEDGFCDIQNHQETYRMHILFYRKYANLNRRDIDTQLDRAQ